MDATDHRQDWFLTTTERGNPASTMPAWSAGNQVEPLAHGAEYFDRLVTAVAGMRSGDQLYLTDWRGDPDQRLRPDGPTVAELLSGAARRGVLVRGLVWRSHLDVLHYHAEQNRGLSDQLFDDGGHLLLDQRLRRLGSHHQKLVVLRHPGRPDRDRAFVGGIDLCHSRRDNAAHRGDPQTVAMAPAYGTTPPWHDIQLELRGPVVADLDLTFRERWLDPTRLRQGHPMAMLRDRLAGRPSTGGPLPPAAGPGCRSGRVRVQRRARDYRGSRHPRVHVGRPRVRADIHALALVGDPDAVATMSGQAI
jgi:phosphatidylserine/phosphatidylglycerophosphate/cardiolipin synthase-like enzyme